MRTFILGDLHLSAHTPRGVAADLVKLVRAHPGDRFMFVGDFFDLSAETPRVASEVAIQTGFGKNPELARAFAEHVDRGGKLAFLGGNHDPELGAIGADAEIARVLGLPNEKRAQIATSPWFIRDGGLHVEHGHIFDPDNAPVHPLVVPSACLGVHFVEEFISPTGAFAYLNVNDQTPLKLFLSAFRLHGARGPYLVARYFYAAAKALAKSGPFFPGAHENDEGEAAMSAFLEHVGVSRDVADAISNLSVSPTMNSFRDTVARLYLDRVISTFSLLVGAAAFGLGRPLVGASFASVGAFGLAASWLRGHDRYGGTVIQRLREGAQGIADATGAKLVVLGHAHDASESDNYANTGSFAFPKGLSGRPYLVIDDVLAPRATRILMPAS